MNNQNQKHDPLIQRDIKNNTIGSWILIAGILIGIVLLNVFHVL